MRLSLLEWLTLMEHGSDVDKEHARKELTLKGLMNLVGQEYEDIDIDNVDLASVHTHQAGLSRLVQIFDQANSATKSKKRMRRDFDEQPVQDDRKKKKVRMRSATQSVCH